MTFAKYLSIEERRKINREKARKYRLANKERLIAYDRARWPARSEKQRIIAHGENKCRVCDILLRSSYGAHNGRRRYCDDHSNRKNWGRLAQAKYRKKLKRRKKFISRAVPKLGREVLNLKHAIIPTENKTDENIESVREVRSEKDTERIVLER